MRLRTALRSSGALWFAPVALALPLLFYIANSAVITRSAYGWAPSVVTGSDAIVVPFSYAVSAGLAVWESGRLKEADIWDLAPARSRYRIAAEALGPVVGLAWLMHLLVVGYALTQTRVLPTLDSLRTLAVALPLCIAHAAIGFAVGLRIRRLIAAPLLAVIVWISTAMAWSLSSPWPRQLSGVYPRSLDFGEVARAYTLLPHLLFTGGIALGALLLWLRRPLRPRVAIAAATALAGVFGAYAMVHDSGYSPRVLTGQAPVTCVGKNPEVCMPEATSDDINAVRTQAKSLLTDLDTAGITVNPRVITDTLQGSGSPRSSNSSVLRAPLTKAAAAHSIRFALLMSAIRFPCDRPDFNREQDVRMWAAENTGEGAAFRALLRQELGMSEDQGSAALKQISDDLDKVRAMPLRDQTAWYIRTVRAACKKST